MNGEFLLLLMIWVAITAAIGIYYWRRRAHSAGIILTYIVLFTASHAFQGAIYTLPNYRPLYDPSIILAGFQQSMIALAAFAVGAMVVVPGLRLINRRVSLVRSASADRANPTIPNARSTQQTQIPTFYLALGVFTYFVLNPILGAIPSLGALVGSLLRLTHIGIALALWQALSNPHSGRRKLLFLIAMTGLWPFITITNEGFLGFGLFPAIFIGCFLLMRMRRASAILLLIPVVLFIGLSLFATYYNGRAEVRRIVWGGNDFEQRINTVVDIFSTRLQLFDPSNINQLSAIDERLALNRLIGLSIERLNTGVIPYAGGQTLVDAALMIIPRALWVDKPIVVGGQELVNRYAGVYMYGSTSVALGQVLELYVNFGTVGVIVGFVLIGMLLAFVDERVMRLIRSGNMMRAAVWLMPIFGLWLVEDNFVTTVGSSIAALITITLVNALIRTLLSERLLRNFRPSESLTRV